jgi:type I restriction enzyme M protein
MARTGRSNAEAPLTTTQALDSLIKSARDILRKDKGLNGDLDRLPLLTWVMFLKFLDDLEAQREEEAALAGTEFKAAIEPPYRWRDWAARSDGITGDELLAFINADECVRPDGTRGPGLFAYLRSLTSSNGDSRRDVIATVYRGVDNRMKSGYLLRDILNKVAGIHFTSTEELHTLGALYESMLREMRDAAGDSGEFYTPRAVVKFMVAVTDPRLGETVLDPAAGTGGFLVETFNHLSRQVKTIEDRRKLQQESIFGGEAKPLPYLLAQMNLLLHGLDAPNIDSGNSLRFRIAEIGERDRVDVILTNPPFGGEEEKGVQANFPEDRQTSETALLFLQLIMRRLRRQLSAVGRPARAAVVVPNGTLFGDGVCARIKQDLLKDFNLHTIVRLPNGVFAPYTSIPTNLLFFDRSGPTKEVWYYEHPLPEGRKNYTKTQPLQFEEFTPCVEWWGNRQENDRAWKVPVEELLANNCNLDRKNPNGQVDLEHLPPEQLVDDILTKERRIIELLNEVKAMLAEKP